MQIITNNPIPTPLLTNPKPHHYENPPLIPGSPPQLTPSRLLGCYFELNSPDDLAVLELYDFVFAIAVGVVVG